jgi:hypothetical protein
MLTETFFDSKFFGFWHIFFSDYFQATLKKLLKKMFEKSFCLFFLKVNKKTKENQLKIDFYPC